jgi:5-keto 4-deoxyuronate isomerase
LRETFLAGGMFAPGKIEFAYVDLDRTVIGSAVPTSGALTLETQPELRAEYFLERRELGVFNVGGAGSVVVDGVTSNWTSWTAFMWDAEVSRLCFRVSRRRSRRAFIY